MVVERTFLWHPVGRPVPLGWRLAAQTVSHHTAHAVLIEPDPAPDAAVAAYAAEVEAMRVADLMGE